MTSQNCMSKRFGDHVPYHVNSQYTSNFNPTVTNTCTDKVISSIYMLGLGVISRIASWGFSSFIVNMNRDW